MGAIHGQRYEERRMVIHRGEIYRCALDPVQGHEQGSTRPVIVVSSDAYNKTMSPLVGILPLTKSPPKNPVHVPLPASETGLDRDSTALIDHARFVDRTRLKGEPVGRLGPEALARVDRQLQRVLGL